MDVRRRELIALLLGAPAWLAGCGTSRGPLPPGELLGQSSAVGHRLRDARGPARRPQSWHDVDVVIVGGGVAGLTAARHLDRAGVRDYVVLELEPVVGGTARAGDCPTSRFPWGAHYLPAPMAGNTPLIEMLSELGAVESIAADGTPVFAEEMLCREPEERLFQRGAWSEGLFPLAGATAAEQAEVAAFRAEIDRWTTWRDSAGRRAFAIPTRLSTDDPEVRQLDRLSMRDWLLERGWQSPRLHWLVDYSCRDDYGLPASETSAWAGLLYFVARQAAPGVEHQPLLTWPEGNGRLIAHLAAIAGERLRTGFAVAQIIPPAATTGRRTAAALPASGAFTQANEARQGGRQGGETPESSEAAAEPGVPAERSDDAKSFGDAARVGGADRVEVVGFDVASDAVAGYRARRVIYAGPRFVAPRLIAGFADRRGGEAEAFPYGSWLVANLQLRERPVESGFPLCWDNVFYESRSLGYVVATHQSGSDEGPTVWTWYYPYTPADGPAVREALLRATRDELAEVVLTDLERAHPEIRGLVTRLDLFRWGHAMVSPRVGFVFSEARLQAARPDGSIHFAHTDLSGVPLFEEAFDQGNRAAQEIVEALS